MEWLAILKHFSSKNADYGAAEKYLLFQHDEFTMKPVLDETGRPTAFLPSTAGAMILLSPVCGQISAMGKTKNGRT